MIDLPLQRAAEIRHGLHLFILGCFVVALLVPYIAAVIDNLLGGKRK